MCRFSLFLTVFAVISTKVIAQDIGYAKKTINTLTSSSYWGRGYTNNGMAKAADFIEREFKNLGLTPIDAMAYKQEFSFPVNTFPDQMKLEVNGKALRPGNDFIVHQASKGISATANLIQKDSLTYVSPEAGVVLSVVPKLTWSVAQKVMDYTLIEVAQKAIPISPKTVKLAITNQLIPNFTAANVVGMVKGTTKPDSILVFTAHYDHLGGMGSSTYFPGANDNASGVALLLDLARYYAKNPSKYSIVFIAFAAEEAGLLGSKYFTENPLFPLSQIRFLWNLDLMGNGDAGATVVNATLHSKEFTLLNKINNANQYLVKINPRGKAANSDHYFFTEKGVPAFFMYTQGGVSAYHDVDDIAATLPLSAYQNIFKLLVAFNKELIN
ncbi:M28 family metallopeptidase [Nubsella zeaxanthinifaciens]|uniref:M28 family metallopeptidase n=1 Tax=Nubsella zeaxanthinifaciens TaxID=392412 RepID=UPI003D05D76D